MTYTGMLHKLTRKSRTACRRPAARGVQSCRHKAQTCQSPRAWYGGSKAGRHGAGIFIQVGSLATAPNCTTRPGPALQSGVFTLSVPISPADMGFSCGLHVKQNYDLPGMLASPELDNVYNTLIQACEKHGVVPGVFCLGVDRAKQLAAQGYKYVGYDTDLGVLINYSTGTMGQLRQ